MIIWVILWTTTYNPVTINKNTMNLQIAADTVLFLYTPAIIISYIYIYILYNVYIYIIYIYDYMYTQVLDGFR